MRLFKAPGTVDGAALLVVFDRVAFERNGENCTAVAPAIAPRVFGNRVETGLPLVGVGGPTNCEPR